MEAAASSAAVASADSIAARLVVVSIAGDTAAGDNTDRADTACWVVARVVIVEVVPILDLAGTSLATVPMVEATVVALVDCS